MDNFVRFAQQALRKLDLNVFKHQPLVAHRRLERLDVKHVQTDHYVNNVKMLLLLFLIQQSVFHKPHAGQGSTSALNVTLQEQFVQNVQKLHS
jgi:uncharacterized membrane protein YoaT (DUF817 family)